MQVNGYYIPDETSSAIIRSPAPVISAPIVPKENPINADGSIPVPTKINTVMSPGAIVSGTGPYSTQATPVPTSVNENSTSPIVAASTGITPFTGLTSFFSSAGGTGDVVPGAAAPMVDPNPSLSWLVLIGVAALVGIWFLRH